MPADGLDRAGVLASGRVEDRAQAAREVFLHECRCLEAIDDDRVPMLHAWSGTDIIASDFGCSVYVPEGSMPCARPLVFDAASADTLVEPDVETGPMGDIFKVADRIKALCGR